MINWLLVRMHIVNFLLFAVPLLAALVLTYLTGHSLSVPVWLSLVTLAVVGILHSLRSWSLNSGYER